MFTSFKYKNPNKFIFKNKKLVNNFKDLYRNISDPWNQHKNFKKEQIYFFLKHFIDLYTKKGKFNLLDVGAGTGPLKGILKKNVRYLGTDLHHLKIKDIIFDNIKIKNKKFTKKFDIIVCLKTIYYIGQQIDNVIKNFKEYLKKNGVLIISYNLKKKSFSNKYFTDIKLRKKLKKNFKELYTIEINRELFLSDSNEEKTTLFIFQKR